MQMITIYKNLNILAQSLVSNTIVINIELYIT